MVKIEMEKTFEFTVTLVGRGETQEKAWADALESFFQNPGEPHLWECEQITDD